MHPKIVLGLRNLSSLKPFYACLLYHLNYVEDKNQPTQATDGKTIFYNPTFWNGVDKTQALFELAHEACHPMLNHLWRAREKDPATGAPYDKQLFFIASDYAVNIMLKDDGFTIPKDALLREDFRGWSTERIYGYLKQQGYKGQSALCCNGGKGFLPPALGHTEVAQAVVTQQAAAIAKGRGLLPGHLAHAVQQSTAPTYPLHVLLERFCDQAMRSEDQSWRRPHRDFLPYGIVMPGPDITHRVSHGIMIYDTSGSVSDEALTYFHNLSGQVMKNLKPERLTIIPSDAEVDEKHVREFTDPNDWPDVFDVDGRGGTDFRPAFEWIHEHGYTPSFVVYLTDMEGDFPDVPPPYPVLWVSCQPGSDQPPFGELVQLPESIG